MRKTLLAILATLPLAMAAADEDIVYDQPEGEVKTYDLTTTQHYKGEAYDFSGIFSRVVFDGDKVWFEDPITTIGIGSWIYGDLEEGIIRIPTGQQIYHQDAEDGYPEMDICVVSGRWNGTTAIPDDAEYADMRLMPDGSIFMPDNRVLIAVDQYGGPVSSNQGYMYIPVDLKTDIVSLPEGVTPKSYCLHYLQDIFNEDIYVLTEMATDGDDFYIKGLCGRYAPEAWSKGRRDGDYVTFTSRQLQGIAQADFLDYMSGGSYTYHGPLEGYAIEEQLRFSYDSATGILSSSQSVLETIGDRIFADAYNAPELRPYTAREAFPKAPVMRDYTDYPEFGFRVVRFKIDPIDTEGNYIDPAGITWRLIADDGPFTFATSSYEYLDSDREAFAWGDTDTGETERGRDIVFESCGLYNVWLYDLSIDTLAVECTFTHDGVSHTAVSNTLVFDNSGVESVETENPAAPRFHVDGTRALPDERGVVLSTGEKRIVTE